MYDVYIITLWTAQCLMIFPDYMPDAYGIISNTHNNKKIHIAITYFFQLYFSHGIIIIDGSKKIHKISSKCVNM